MRRRHFLAAAGTVGIATTVSAGSVASAAFTSINASVLLQEFQPAAKTVYDSFLTTAATNFESLGLEGQQHIKRIVLPTRTMSQGPEHIVYRNQAGQYISLYTTKGMEWIKVSSTY